MMHVAQITVKLKTFVVVETSLAASVMYMGRCAVFNLVDSTIVELILVI